MFRHQTAKWRTFHDHHRPHGALGGGTPAERIEQLSATIPAAEVVHATYGPSREPIRSQNTRYRWLLTNARVACSTQTLHETANQVLHSVSFGRNLHLCGAGAI
jgi:hypothetical protein